MARLYGRRWGKARKEHLEQYPFCTMCENDGRMHYGIVVDHVIPHRGDPVLFWDETNWQTLCGMHHDAAKQSEEKTGTARGCDIKGVPRDPSHHWSANK